MPDSTTPAAGQQPPSGEGQRVPRRLVLLAGDETSAVEEVLAEFTGAEPRGKDIHVEIERLAARHPSRHIAAEWLAPLGWTRFMTCCKS